MVLASSTSCLCKKLLLLLSCTAMLPGGGTHDTRGQLTRSQNVHQKTLSFLAKSKIGIFACFFAQI
jgi:hypothetical protein